MAPKFASIAWQRSHRYLRAVIRLALLIGFLIYGGWLMSQRRQEEIAVRRMSCAKLPWHFLLFEAEPLYSAQELYLPSRPSPLDHQRQTIGMVQTCSGARKWPIMEQLVENHRQYAFVWGYEYDFYLDGHLGIWTKVHIVIQKLLTELDKPADKRLRWVFYTDMDTLILNDRITLESFLPPSGRDNNPFLLITEDHNGLNAGTFFIRVDTRSVEFLQIVLSYSQHRLRWADQSAMSLVISEQNLIESGQVVYLPSSWINSYEAESAFERALPTFQLHFPSVGFKRTAMLPLLAKLRRSELSMNTEMAELAQSQLADAVHRFWTQRQP